MVHDADGWVGLYRHLQDGQRVGVHGAGGRSELEQLRGVDCRHAVRAAAIVLGVRVVYEQFDIIPVLLGDESGGGELVRRGLQRLAVHDVCVSLD